MSMALKMALMSACSLGVLAVAGAQDKLSGETLFKSQCAACHSAVEGGAIRQGPSLYAVLGRQAGVAPAMQYSASFHQALDGKVWDEALLQTWLEDPQEVAAETIMMYKQSDPEKRQAIIDYLKTLH